MKLSIPFLAALLFAGAAAAQTATLKVRGEASVKTVPELMNVRIPLEVKESSYSGTSDALTDKYNALEKALVKAGVPEAEIQSSGLNIRENYRYENRERIMDGYAGNLSVSIELTYTPENMAAIMNTLKQDEFNFGYSLTFGLSERQKTSLLEKTLQEAIADGRRKAEIMASTLEVRILSLDEVSFGYSDDRPDILQPKMRMAEAAADAGGLDLNPLEMEIRKEVMLVWKVAE
jgi:hypothetical protein